MTSTRDKILECARSLFNERGINEVSIADIARAASISKGNLTYHFAKKELIVEALVLRSDQMPALSVATTLEDVVNNLAHMQKVVQDNAFYFRHYAQVAQLVPRVAQQQKKAYAFYRAVMRKSFEELSRRGVLRDHVRAEEIDRTIDAMFMTCVFWLPFSELKGSKDTQQALQQCAFYLELLLNEEGKTRLASLL